MTVLNNSLPIIDTYDSKRPSIAFSGNFTLGVHSLLKEYFNQKFNFWYCLFSCHNSFEIYKLTDLIEKDILYQIYNKEAFIVLDNSLEPFTRSIDSIYKNIVIKEKIPASQIILMTNMYDAKEYSDNLARNLNQESIKIFWFNVFEKDLQDAIKHIYRDNVPKTLENKPYPKKFLNFNRRWRLHRPFLITLFYGKNLLDNGHISFGPCDQEDNWTKKWKEMLDYFSNDVDTIELLKKNENVKNINSLFLDSTDLHINKAQCTIDTNRYYEETYFSVVSETTFFTKNFYPNSRFLSEKTFKPIAMKHPFILVSVPKSLAILKEMGYKTFSPIIDESYDDETNDSKRMTMIVNEIERLCCLNENELEHFLTQAKEICNYNYENLMLKKKFIIEL